MGCIATVHLTLETIARSPVVQVASGGAVAYIAIAAGRIAIPRGGRVGGISLAGVGIRGMGSSNIRIGIVDTVGIGIVIAVSIAGVVGSIAVRGVAVGGVGSIGRGTATH